jgi:S-formylglutathione hydrolase FrmB
MERRSGLELLCDLRGDLRLDVVESAALRGNALGDPAERKLLVYLPRGYDAQGSQRYPVLYVLHGYTGNAAALVSTRPWERNVVQWIDALIAEKKMPPAILAVVDGFTRLGGSQYVDSMHNGDYAAYVVRDVVGFVDARYRTIASEGGRAVLGKSSGGFGAMHLAMEHPGVFAAFASHSGDANFRCAHPAWFAVAQRELERFSFDVVAYVDAFERMRKHSQSAHVTMEMLAYAAAYSPRERKAFAFDLPFDLETGGLRDDVFDRWLAFDPVVRVPQRLDALAPLRLRYLDCGRRDEYGLDIGARLIARTLREAGLSVRHEEFDDDHRNVGYRYEISLPALAGVLDGT